MASGRALIITEASKDSWLEIVDKSLKEDENNAITKIKWKPSRFGGRTWLFPSATPASIAAVRRRRGRKDKAPSFTDNITEVRIGGELGIEAEQVLNRLLTHACASTGLALSPAATDKSPTIGQWQHLARTDPSAHPGRVRLYVCTQEELDTIYAALHGQVIQVGTDHFAVTVHNDLQDAAGASGKGHRVGRASISP